jgi:hypothetical protein
MWARLGLYCISWRYTPDLQITATDISPALEVASENARRHGVDGRVHLARADLLPRGRFDLGQALYPTEANAGGLHPRAGPGPDGGLDGLTISAA